MGDRLPFLGFMKQRRRIKLIAVVFVICAALFVYARSQQLRPKPIAPQCNKDASNAPCYLVLTAVATDDKGAQTTSSPITIHIKPRQKCEGRGCPQPCTECR